MEVPLGHCPFGNDLWRRLEQISIVFGCEECAYNAYCIGYQAQNCSDEQIQERVLEVAEIEEHTL